MLDGPILFLGELGVLVVPLIPPGVTAWLVQQCEAGTKFTLLDKPSSGTPLFRIRVGNMPKVLGELTLEVQQFLPAFLVDGDGLAVFHDHAV